jgi:hypothetical protein
VYRNSTTLYCMMHTVISRRNWSGQGVTFLAAFVLSSIMTSLTAWAADAVPDWPRLIQTHRDRLEKLDSDQSAIQLFVGTIGPAVSLADAAGTLGAKGISSRMAKDLLLPDLTRSAQRLLAALMVWTFAERLTGPMADHPKTPSSFVVGSPAQVEWLIANGPFPSLTETVQQLKAVDTSKESSSDAGGSLTAVAILSGRLAQEAHQQAMSEWWQLKTWKDRVRVARGQARLCGTWQWAIHNHQNHHQEQKFSLIFPPPGKDGTGISGLSEIVVLGDLVYLRWEIEGKTQEDSLLFSKEGQRLEGTFVNSQGGWGSISGKRTASCTLQ